VRIRKQKTVAFACHILQNRPLLATGIDAIGKMSRSRPGSKAFSSSACADGAWQRRVNAIAGHIDRCRRRWQTPQTNQNSAPPAPALSQRRLGGALQQLITSRTGYGRLPRERAHEACAQAYGLPITHAAPKPHTATSLHEA
jgi:hypothetical protein